MYEEGISLRIRTLASLALVLSLGVMTVAAHADLSSTVFGFPVVTQNGSSTVFNQATSNASDLETLNAGFPIACTGLKMGPPQAGRVHILGFNFDTVDADPYYGQTTNQAMNTVSTSFTQTSEGANFAYPFSSIGIVSLPGFGFS